MAPMPEPGAAADGVPSGCVPSSPRSPAPCQSENWLGLTRHCLSQSPQYCPMLVVSGCLAEVRSLLQSTPPCQHLYVGIQLSPVWPPGPCGCLGPR